MQQLRIDVFHDKRNVVRCRWLQHIGIRIGIAAYIPFFQQLRRNFEHDLLRQRLRTQRQIHHHLLHDQGMRRILQIGDNFIDPLSEPDNTQLGLQRDFFRRGSVLLYQAWKGQA